jgi:hypothetical protein
MQLFFIGLSIFWQRIVTMAVLRPLYLFIQSENLPRIYQENPNKSTERRIDKRVLPRQRHRLILILRVRQIHLVYRHRDSYRWSNRERHRHKQG